MNVVLLVAAMDADVDWAGEVLKPLIAIHILISILKLNLSNNLKKNSGCCLNTRNIKFSK